MDLCNICSMEGKNSYNSVIQPFLRTFKSMKEGLLDSVMTVTM